jgi:hypothetical protein
MNEDRAKKNIEAIQHHMQSLLRDCPEIKDVAVAINWDDKSVPEDSETSIPASMVFSNRKTDSECHTQAIELSRILTDTAQSIHERVLSAVLETNFGMAQRLAELEAKEL